MDALLVGSLTAAGTVTGMLLWLLLARPEVAFGLLGEPPSWLHEEERGSLRALRLIFAALVLIFGFLTGLTVAFLAATA